MEDSSTIGSFSSLHSFRIFGLNGLWMIVLFAPLSVSPSILAGDAETAMAFVVGAEKAFNGGDVPTALAMSERAVATDGDCASAHFLKGQCYEQQNLPREALSGYEKAAEIAKKTNNNDVLKKANDAFKRLAPGLLDLKAVDHKLVEKLMPLATKALEKMQLDTARQALQMIVALSPDNEKAKKLLKQTESAIAARGDPIKGKIAAAAMQEVWYYFGMGDKDKAKEMARAIVKKQLDKAVSKEAAILIAANFDMSGSIKDEIKKTKVEMNESVAVALPPVAATDLSGASGTTTPKPAQTAFAPPKLNLNDLEKTVLEDTKNILKEKLPTAFMETYAKGMDFYKKCAPGSDGQQKHVAEALEQFIRCDAMFLRMEDEKIVTQQVQDTEATVSMLRYACMKMTILNQ